MNEHDHHHGHKSHGHPPHEGVVHSPAAGTGDAYHEAHAAAQPDAGRKVISIELDAREVD